jgi:hypothetical protein
LLVVLLVAAVGFFSGTAAWQVARSFEQKARDGAAFRRVDSFPFEYEAARFRRVADVSWTVAGAAGISAGVIAWKRGQRRKTKDPGVRR